MIFIGSIAILLVFYAKNICKILACHNLFDHWISFSPLWKEKVLGQNTEVSNDSYNIAYSAAIFKYKYVIQIVISFYVTLAEFETFIPYIHNILNIYFRLLRRRHNFRIIPSVSCRKYTWNTLHILGTCHMIHLGRALDSLIFLPISLHLLVNANMKEKYIWITS